MRILLIKFKFYKFIIFRSVVSFYRATEVYWAWYNLLKLNQYMLNSKLIFKLKVLKIYPLKQSIVHKYNFILCTYITLCTILIIKTAKGLE